MNIQYSVPERKDLTDAIERRKREQAEKNQGLPKPAEFRPEEGNQQQ